jgi:2-amino-4-hydroxy-6-hydroxymethyldihydropteridine diphosphokinase
MRIVYIGLGANLASQAGGPEATLAAAVGRMSALGRVTARSRLYSTAPVGFADQPRFVNAVVRLETLLEPREILDALLGIEAEFGRDRSAGVANGPRTLDLDILLIEGEQVNESGLVAPHPRLHQRAFALAPLCEVGAGARDPVSGVTMAEWLEQLPPSERESVEPIESEVWQAMDCGSEAG